MDNQEQNSIAFNRVKWITVSKEVATCTPRLMTFVVKYYGKVSSIIFSEITPETLLARLRSWGPTGRRPRTVSIMLDFVARVNKFREAFDGMGVEATAFMDSINIGMTKTTVDTITAVPFLQRELGHVDIVTYLFKTAGLPPRRHTLTAEEITLSESVGTPTAEEGGVDVVGIRVGFEGQQTVRAAEVVRYGGMDCLAFLVCQTDN